MSISPPAPRLFRPRVDIQGTYLGVLYHTHNGGTQLALGRTERQLTVVWRTVVENLGRKEVTRCATYRLAFGDPAPDLLRTLDEKRLAECLDAYKQALARAARAEGPPQGMRFCLDSEYTSDDFPVRGEGFDLEYPQLQSDDHTWCKRCAYGLLWEGDTSPERQQRAWEATLWNERFVRLMVEHMNREEARGARVQPADYALRERPDRPPGDPTHVLHADFGHHSAGIVMSPVGEVDFGENFHTRQILAFVRAETIDLPFVEETVRAWQTLLENEERRRKEEWHNGWAEREAKAAASGRQLLQEFARALGMEV